MGWAALQAGLGENTARRQTLAEQMREFDQQLAQRQQEEQLRNQLAYSQLGQQAYQFDTSTKQRGREFDTTEARANRAADSQNRQFDISNRTQSDQFNRTLDQRGQQFNQQLGQEAYQFDAGAYDKAIAQQRAQQFELLQTGLQGDIGLRNRLAEIGAQGDLQYGLHGMDDQARLQQEALQQAGLGDRSQTRAKTQLENQRLEQNYKMVWDVQRSIIEHAPNMTPENYAHVQEQFHKWASSLNADIPFDIPQPAGAGGYDPQATLEQLKKDHPDLPLIRFPDGSIGLPKGYNQANTPEAIGQKHDAAAQLKDKEIDAQLKQHQAVIDQKSLEDRRNTVSSYYKELDKARSRSMMKSTDNPTPTLNQGFLDQEQKYIRDQFISRTGYVPVSTREELAALQPGTSFILPDGRTGIRQ